MPLKRKLRSKNEIYDPLELEGDYVYFISDGIVIKIGKTNNINKRLGQLQVGNPRKLELLGTSPLLNEKEVHDKFKDKLIRGECFEIHNEIINFCNERKTRHYELLQEDKEELIKRILILEGYD